MGWLPVLWTLRELADSLEGLSTSATASQASASPTPPDVSPPFPRPDGKGLAVSTFPSRLDAVLFGGLTGEVWLRPGVGEVVYGTPAARGEVAAGSAAGGGVATGEALSTFFFGGARRGGVCGRNFAARSGPRRVFGRRCRRGADKK